MYLKVTPKEMPPILVCWSTPYADGGGIVVQVEPDFVPDFIKKAAVWQSGKITL